MMIGSRRDTYYVVGTLTTNCVQTSVLIVLLLLSVGPNSTTSSHFAEAAFELGSNIASRKYSPSSQLMNMSVTKLTHAPASGGLSEAGKEYFKALAVDPWNRQLYVANIVEGAIQRFDLETSKWVTLATPFQGVFGNQKVAAPAISADGRDLYFSQYPYGKVFKFDNQDLYSGSRGDNFHEPFTKIAGQTVTAGQTPISGFSAGVGDSAKMYQVDTMRVFGSSTIIGVHSTSTSSCLWELKISTKTVSQWVCDCTASSLATSDGIGSGASCQRIGGLTSTHDGLGALWYFQEVTGAIRKVQREGSGSGTWAVTTVYSYDICESSCSGGTDSQTWGLLVHPFFPNVSWTVQTEYGVLVHKNGDYWDRIEAGTTAEEGPSVQGFEAVVRNPYALDLDLHDGSIYVASGLGGDIYRICCLWWSDTLVKYLPLERVATEMGLKTSRRADQKYPYASIYDPFSGYFISGGGTITSGVRGVPYTLSPDTGVQTAPTGATAFLAPMGDWHTSRIFVAIPGQIGLISWSSTWDTQVICGPTATKATFSDGACDGGSGAARLGQLWAMNHIGTQGSFVATDGHNNFILQYNPTSDQLTPYACAPTETTGTSTDGVADVARCDRPVSGTFLDLESTYYFNEQGKAMRKILGGSGGGGNIKDRYVYTYHTSSNYKYCYDAHPFYHDTYWNFNDGGSSGQGHFWLGGQLQGLTDGFPSTSLVKTISSGTVYMPVYTIAFDSGNRGIVFGSGASGYTFSLCCLWENVTDSNDYYTRPAAFDYMKSEEGTNRVPGIAASTDFRQVMTAVDATPSLGLWLIYYQTTQIRKVRWNPSSMKWDADSVTIKTVTLPNCFFFSEVTGSSTIYFGYDGRVTSASGVSNNGLETSFFGSSTSAQTFAAGSGISAKVGQIISMAGPGGSISMLDKYNHMIIKGELNGQDVTHWACLPRAGVTQTTSEDGLSSKALCANSMKSLTFTPDFTVAMFLEQRNLATTLVLRKVTQGISGLTEGYVSSVNLDELQYNQVPNVVMHPLYTDVFIAAAKMRLVIVTGGIVKEYRIGQSNLTLADHTANPSLSATTEDISYVNIDPNTGTIYCWTRVGKMFSVHSIFGVTGPTASLERSSTWSPGTRSKTEQTTSQSESLVPTATIDNTRTDTTTQTDVETASDSLVATATPRNSRTNHPLFSKTRDPELPTLTAVETDSETDDRKSYSVAKNETSDTKSLIHGLYTNTAANGPGVSNSPVVAKSDTFLVENTSSLQVFMTESPVSELTDTVVPHETATVLAAEVTNPTYQASPSMDKSNSTDQEEGLKNVTATEQETDSTANRTISSDAGGSPSTQDRDASRSLHPEATVSENPAETQAPAKTASAALTVTLPAPPTPIPPTPQPPEICPVLPDVSQKFDTTIGEQDIGSSGLNLVFEINWNDDRIGELQPNATALRPDSVVDGYEVTLRLAENPEGLKLFSSTVLRPPSEDGLGAVNLTVLNSTTFGEDPLSSSGSSSTVKVVDPNWIRSTFFLLEIPPLKGYATDEDEILDLQLTPSFFRQDLGCPVTGKDFTITSITIVSVPDPVAIVTQRVATAITAVAGSSSVAAGGAATAGDAQSLALIAMMRCAQPVEKKMTKNTRLLAPLALEDTYGGMIIGNLMLLLIIIILQGIAFLLFRLVIQWTPPPTATIAKPLLATPALNGSDSTSSGTSQNRKEREDSSSEEDNRPRQHTISEATAAARFPALTLIGAILTQQGTGAASIGLFTSAQHPGDYLLALLGSAISLGLPITVGLLQTSTVNAYFGEYELDADEIKSGKIKLKPLWRNIRIILPKGRWFPAEMRKSFGPLFSAVGQPSRIWGTMMLWSPTLVLIIASVRPLDQSGCVAQFGLLGAIQYIICLVYLIFRPLRSIPANLLSCFSSFLLGVVFSASATLAADPISPKARSFVQMAVQAQLGITLTRALYMLAIVALERFSFLNVPYTQKWEWRPVLHLCGSGSRRKGINSGEGDGSERGSGSSLTESDDVMMKEQQERPLHRTPPPPSAMDTADDHTAAPVLIAPPTTAPPQPTANDPLDWDDSPLGDHLADLGFVEEKLVNKKATTNKESDDLESLLGGPPAALSSAQALPVVNSEDIFDFEKTAREEERKAALREAELELSDSFGGSVLKTLGKKDPTDNDPSMLLRRASSKRIRLGGADQSPNLSPNGSIHLDLTTDRFSPGTSVTCPPPIMNSPPTLPAAPAAAAAGGVADPLVVSTATRRIRAPKKPQYSETVQAVIAKKKSIGTNGQQQESEQAEALKLLEKDEDAILDLL